MFFSNYKDILIRNEDTHSNPNYKNIRGNIFLFFFRTSQKKPVFIWSLVILVATLFPFVNLATPLVAIPILTVPPVQWCNMTILTAPIGSMPFFWANKTTLFLIEKSNNSFSWKKIQNYKILAIFSVN